jgi:hypothetical protein
LPAQCLTRLRANHFRATQLNSLIRKAGVEGLLNWRGDILANAWQLRDANQDFAFIAKVLHDCLAEPQRPQHVAHQSQLYWLAEAQLQLRTTLKVNALSFPFSLSAQ